MKRVIFSPEALADLEDVTDFIARDNPPRAFTFVEELERKARVIVRAPKAYPARSSLARGLRLAVLASTTSISGSRNMASTSFESFTALAMPSPYFVLCSTPNSGSEQNYAAHWLSTRGR